VNRNLPSVVRIAGAALASIGPLLYAFAIQAQTAPKIPLIEGLIVTHAVHAIEGDYETMSSVGTINAQGVSFTVSGDAPQAAGARPQSVSVTRTVRQADLATARTYKYFFTTVDDDVIPGTTAIGMSALVISDLRSHGSSQLTLDGRAGGLMGALGDLLGSVDKSGGMATAMAGMTGGRMQASGVLKLAEPQPVGVSVIVNGKRAMLPAYHLHGRIGTADASEDADLYVLDDPANPLMLHATIAKDRVDVVKIDFPTSDAPKAMERELAENRRTAIYGIYFDFNSATIKPQSESVLREIVDVMKREPSWTLKVEGHTDNVGGDAKNQDLSARRAAAVKQALVQRGVPEARLTTGGYGASVPRETNTTLAGRARNRRVELSRV
jgi:outer membrane protein OmpA-like peptidoglycan-associated protein